MKIKNTWRGFTLIELLVVVLIIGVLAAIALPMYQKAVLKSRFAALMPIGKSMADSNEAYYLEHGNYATNVQELPVQGQMQYPDGTELEFGTSSDYAYVLATRDNNFPNNYIVYQKHSTNYPGEIHCEALKDNTQAAAVCKSFGATENKGVILTSTHDTWVLSGTGHGVAPGVDAGLDNALTDDETDEPVDPYSCDKAIALGYTCTPDKEHGKKTVCATVGSDKICRTKTYTENGYVSTTCKTNDSGVCISNRTDIYYDEDGNKIAQRTCNYNASYGGGNCSSVSANIIVYNGEGIYRECDQLTANGHCSQYGSEGYIPVDNGDGSKTVRKCSTLNTDGTCQTYADSGRTYVAFYDSNNNKTAERYCNSVDENGVCNSAYVYRSGYYYGIDYKEDTTTGGRLQLYCTALDTTDGKTCKTYNLTSANLYFYDKNGNEIGQKHCSQVAEDGSHCTQYDYSYVYSSDGDGPALYSQFCSGGNINTTTGECSTYTSTSVSRY